jgi:hypothetical protein
MKARNRNAALDPKKMEALLESIRQALTAAAKLVSKPRKMWLPILAFMAAVVFTACPQPDDPIPSPTPVEPVDKEIAIDLKYNGASVKNATFSEKDQQQSMSVGWTSEYQLNTDKFSISATNADLLSGNFEIKFTKNGTATISGGDRTALSNIAFGDNGKISVVVGNDIPLSAPLSSITLNVPSQSGPVTVAIPATGNLSASMQWLSQYQNNVPNVSMATQLDKYQQQDLQSNTRQLDLTLTTPANADNYDKEITIADFSTLAGKLEAVLGQRQVNSAGLTPQGSYSVRPLPPLYNQAIWANVFGANNVMVNIPANPTAEAPATISINNYSMQSDGSMNPNIDLQWFALPTDLVNAIKNVGDLPLQVTITGTSGTTLVSLTDVHYIYQAVYGADHANYGSGAANVIKPAAPITAKKPDGTPLVPSFKSTEWFERGSTSSSTVNINLYDKYTSVTPIMDGITVKFMQEGADNKPVIEYNTKIDIQDLGYNENYFNMPIYGFGIVKGTSGSLAAKVPNSSPIIIGATLPNNGIGYVKDAKRYFEYLRVAGLADYSELWQPMSLNNNVPVKHNMNFRLDLQSGTDRNIVTNGMLSFIRAHSDAGKMALIDTVSYPNTGNTFDGKEIPNFGATGRADTAATNYPADITKRINKDGKALDSFAANIDTGLARYLMDKLKIATFANTNITGDGYKLLQNIGAGDIVNINLTNVNLKGDHDDAHYHSGWGMQYFGDYRGVINIEGNAPAGIASNGTDSKSKGYLKLKNVPLSMYARNFGIVDLRDVSDLDVKQHVEASGSSADALSRAMIFANKAAMSNSVMGIVGYGYDAVHKVFPDSNNQLKFTGLTSDGFIVPYAARNSVGAVPFNFNEDDWILKANNGATDDLYTTWPALDPSLKWDAATFNAIPVSALQSPADVRLAYGDAANPDADEPRPGMTLATMSSVLAGRSRG